MLSGGVSRGFDDYNGKIRGESRAYWAAAWKKRRSARY
jgi:hypothetical protein